MPLSKNRFPSSRADWESTTAFEQPTRRRATPASQRRMSTTARQRLTKRSRSRQTGRGQSNQSSRADQFDEDFSSNDVMLSRGDHNLRRRGTTRGARNSAVHPTADRAYTNSVGGIAWSDEGQDAPTQTDCCPVRVADVLGWFGTMLKTMFSVMGLWLPFAFFKCMSALAAYTAQGAGIGSTVVALLLMAKDAALLLVATTANNAQSSWKNATGEVFSVLDLPVKEIVGALAMGIVNAFWQFGKVILTEVALLLNVLVSIVFRIVWVTIASFVQFLLLLISPTILLTKGISKTANMAPTVAEAGRNRR